MPPNAARLARKTAACLALMGLAWLSCGCERLFGPTSDEKMPPLPDSLRMEVGQRVEFLSSVVRLDDDNAEAFFRRAKLRARAQRTQAAAEGIRQAVALDPDNPTYRYWQAVIALQEKNYSAADSILTLAHSLGFREARANPLRAEVALQAGRYDEALLAIRRATDAGLNSPTLDYIRGGCYRQRGDTAKAKAYLRAAIAQDSALLPAYVELADLHLRFDEPNPAQTLLQRALHLGQADPQLYYQTATLLEGRRQRDSAAFWHAKAVSLDDSLWQSQIALGEREFKRARYAEGSAYYERALAVKPDIEGAYYRLGFIYEYYLKDWPQARRAYGMATRLFPEDEKAARALRRVEFKLNRPQVPTRTQTANDST